jgi:hypothetical protein
MNFSSSQLINDFNESGSFVIVKELDNYYDDTKSSKNISHGIQDAKDQKTLSWKKGKLDIESLVGVSEENQELFNIVKQKIKEIDNVVEMQQVDALDFISSESQVLIIGNHNDEDDTLVLEWDLIMQKLSFDME